MFYIGLQLELHTISSTANLLDEDQRVNGQMTRFELASVPVT